MPYYFEENPKQYEVPAPALLPYKEEEKPGRGAVWNPVTRHFERGIDTAQQEPSRMWTIPSRLTSTTATTTGTMMPIKPDIPLPTFTLPERDIGRVKELRREAISTPMRGMRQEARRALARIGTMEGPMAKEAYRGWTEGLGTGISSIASHASLQAEQLYGIERAEEINAMMVNFQAELNEYFASWGRKTTQITTTRYKYGEEEEEEEYTPWTFDPATRRWAQPKPNLYEGQGG